VVAGKVLVCRYVGAGERSVHRRSVAHPAGSRGSGTACSPAGAGAGAISLAGVSRCEATHAARRRSIRACRER
jgi:hypothetical protein